MLEAWIWVTLLAAFLQCLRTGLQKQLNRRLGTNAVTFTRYGFGFPLAILYVALLASASGEALPALNLTFAAYCIVAGVAQIIATSLLIQLFALRNFAVGTTYSKTESLQTALFGLVILGEAVSLGAALGILVGMAGVMLLSWSGGPSRLPSVWTGKAAQTGLLCGALFAVTAVSIRAAALSLTGHSVLMQAGFTLLCMTVLQSLLLLGYLAWRERDELRRLAAAWRPATLVGVTGVAGSACWFTAMTLQNAAYVRSLGQVELVFTFLASHLIFRERTSGRELAGIALIVAGVLLLLNFR